MNRLHVDCAKFEFSASPLHAEQVSCICPLFIRVHAIEEKKTPLALRPELSGITRGKSSVPLVQRGGGTE